MSRPLVRRVWVRATAPRLLLRLLLGCMADTVDVALAAREEPRGGVGLASLVGALAVSQVPWLDVEGPALVEDEAAATIA